MVGQISNSLLNIENPVLRARSEFNGFAGKEGELFASIGGRKNPNHNH
jgi:hypothetical protein